MARLPETEAVLAELSSMRGMIAGEHYGDEPIEGDIGLQIGSMPFDPTRHDPMRIDPFSIMELVTDEPQVPLVIPHKPLQVRVITESHATSDDPRVIKLKHALVDSLKESIDESLPGIGDLTYSYHVGQPSSKQRRFDIDLVETDGSPISNAKSVAELCRDSLAFVISDFYHLPLEAHGQSMFSSTIGVKVNHNSEMALPAGIGIVPLGGRGELNTDKPKVLAAYNAGSEKVHAQIIARLEKVGIKVAQVVFDPQHGTIGGLNIAVADGTIARATRSLIDR